MAVCVFWIEAGISMRDLGQPNISLSLDFKVLLKPVWSEKGAKNFDIGYLSPLYFLDMGFGSTYYTQVS